MAVITSPVDKISLLVAKITFVVAEIIFNDAVMLLQWVRSLL